MKHYTQQKIGGGSEWACAEQDYVAYVQAIRDALPPDLRLLCDRTSGWSLGRIYLNDSSVKRVDADFGDRTLEIVLSGETLNQEGHQIGERLFTLHYGGVQRFICAGEYGDPPLALLYADHIEMPVAFGQFRLTYIDRLYEAKG